MNRNTNYLFTSESVGEGHPDKICDQISDAILDKALSEDPESRVACECFAATNLVLIGGEITTKTPIDFVQIARDTIKNIGYTDDSMGFSSETCTVNTVIHSQSEDIAQGVNRGEGLFTEMGAGDQGLMFGYACRQTETLMPAPIDFSHKIIQKAATLRKNGTLDFLRPDGKTQVTVRYKNKKPVHISTVVLSHQHTEGIEHDELEAILIRDVIKPSLPKELITKETVYFVNPTGRFVLGGPHGDAGLTGRKIIADTYGGYARHGGGAFSGKDPSKVDRSAAYMARYIAKNLVASGLLDEVEIQLAYAIGVSKPVSVHVETFDSSTKAEALCRLVFEVFDLTPSGIVDAFDLKRPIYLPTATYGHFGRSEENFPWEKTDRIEAIKRAWR